MSKKKKGENQRSEEKAIREYLTKKYGRVNNEWEITIRQLMDNLRLYDQCKAKLAETGIFNETEYKKNPLLATIKDLQASISKETQALTLTPYIQEKLGQLGEDENNDDWLGIGSAKG